MISRKFQDLNLSLLGLGLMRLPLLDEKNDIVDEAKTKEMINYAISNGINYFDTAYVYHHQKSEVVVGKILKEIPRDKFYLADKFPGFDLDPILHKEKIFEEQLERCQVDYFDFYLFHNVTERNVDYYMDDKLGLMDYLLKQKELGKIKHLGFSSHGNLVTMRKFLEKYHENLEFCQIQLNWFDYHFQDAKAKISLLNEFNIPIWVMEPLRGGKLVNLNTEHVNYLKSIKDVSILEWSFDFLKSIPNVKMILSGMSSMEQLKQNIDIFAHDNLLKDEDINKLLEMSLKLESTFIPCTSCKYCLPKCPKQLNIPQLLKAYSENSFINNGIINKGDLWFIEENKFPNECIGCKSCEKICPQTIKISSILKEFAERIK